MLQMDNICMQYICVCAYKVQDFDSRDRGLHPEFGKSPLVKVGERLWFWLNVNEHVAYVLLVASRFCNKS